MSLLPVNDRKYVFHFRPKPKPKLEKHLALGRIPKPKPKVQIYVKIGGMLLKFNVSNDLTHWDFSCSDRPNLKLIRL